MLTAAPRTVFAARVYRALIGTVVARHRVEQFDHHRRGHRRHVDFAVGKERRRVPVLLEDAFVAHHLAVDGVPPRIVAVEDHLHGVVVRRQRVENRELVRVEGRTDARRAQPFADGGDRVGGGLLGIDCGGCRLPLFCRFGCRRAGAEKRCLQRVDLPEQRFGGAAQRVARRGLAGRALLRACSTWFACRRAADGREGEAGKDVFFHRSVRFVTLMPGFAGSLLASRAPSERLRQGLRSSSAAASSAS